MNDSFLFQFLGVCHIFNNNGLVLHCMFIKNYSYEVARLMVLFLMLVSTKTEAQIDSINDFKLALNGYIETYYLYDFDNPGNHDRPNFYVSHDRHNELNLNIGMLRFAAENKKVKTALALMTGSYVNANLAYEPGVLKNIYEANVSVKLNSKKDLWLQAGIFNSHIGFESAIGADCYTLSRSIAADNSPYYESGLRLNYKSKNTNWDLSFFVLNGWQRIQRLDNNTMPSFGTQITYSAKNTTFNSSNYFGNEGTDKLPTWRYFHNFYMVSNLGASSKLIVGLDVGLQQYPIKSNIIYWWSPQVVYRYQMSKKFAIAGRIENYFDKDAVITLPIKNAQLNVIGMAVNLDYKIINNVLFRIEFKQLNNSDQIFEKNNSLTHYNSSVAGAFTVKF